MCFFIRQAFFEVLIFFVKLSCLKLKSHVITRIDPQTLICNLYIDWEGHSQGFRYYFWT